MRRCRADSTGYGPCDACADDAVCNEEKCTGMRSDAIGASVPGCCAKSGRCGIDVSFFASNHGYAAGCLELDAPGRADPACPSSEIALPFGDGKTITLQGCRTRDNACGYDVNLPAIVNLGCTASPRKLPSE